MMDLRRRTHCPSCGQTVLAAPGVCTLCGEPLIVSTPGGRLSVVVEQIPSLQRRQDIARDLADWLDVEDHHALADRLGAGKVALGDGLSPAAAGALRDALAARKAPAQVTEPTALASPPLGKALANPLGLALLGIGAVVGIFTLGIGCAVGVVAYALVVAFAMQAGKVGGAASVIRAPMTVEGLEGWEEFGPALSRLMGRLPEASRSDLARLATASAEIQADLQAGGVIAYASGGGEGRFAGTVRSLLEHGVTAGQAIDAGRPGAEDALRRVANAAEEAMARVDALTESGSSVDPAPLISTLDEALNEAEAVVEEVRVVEEVEVAR